MMAPKVIAAGAVLVSLLLTQACSSTSSTDSKAANRDNSNETPSTASVLPPPPTSTSQCDPNYSECVPIASDVDCAGGNGNGPAYVKGPVTVIGKDVYKLDGDHDGIGCE